MDTSLIIPDVYKMLEDNASKLSPEEQGAFVEEFGEECKEFMRGAIGGHHDRSGRLRLSGVGKPFRQLWNGYHGIKARPITGQTYMKFLYGHLTEAMVLTLVKLSGHKVTEQQKEVEVEGILGHQDCRIDGVLVDVKSASSYGFKKFRYNTLHEDDPFGYIAQLKAYSCEAGDTKFAWLAMDKQNGDLAWLEYDMQDTSAPYFETCDYDIKERLRDIKEAMKGPLPSLCYEDVPDGKSGNRKLATGCSYCDFRETCYPDLRTFSYSGGPRYMTKVVRDPKVREVPIGF